MAARGAHSPLNDNGRMSMLKPNVILMFVVVAILGVIGWVAAGTWSVSTELVLGVFAGIAGIAGTTIRDLVLPPKSDVQLLLEHEESMAKIKDAS